METSQGKPFSGGCQCGAVRYRLDMQPQQVHYCHCRMCQRAVGNVFATFAPVHRERLTWEGTPSFFRSSSIATRGFCARCGTPLCFSYDDSKWICLSIGSFDDPLPIRPEAHYGIESQLPWLHIADALPREPTDTVRVAEMITYQKPS